MVNLTEETIEVNSRYFNSLEEVPKRAITMGMGSIMKARKIVLLATGGKKAPVIEKLVNENYITTEFPVSFLRANRDVTIIIDDEARGNLILEK